MCITTDGAEEGGAQREEPSEQPEGLRLLHTGGQVGSQHGSVPGNNSGLEVGVLGTGSPQSVHAGTHGAKEVGQ